MGAANLRPYGRITPLQLIMRGPAAEARALVAAEARALVATPSSRSQDRSRLQAGSYSPPGWSAFAASRSFSFSIQRVGANALHLLVGENAGRCDIGLRVREKSPDMAFL